jgi:hypothetical protein
VRLAAAVVVVAACQRNADPCATAFHTVQPLMFGGAAYAGPPALVFGMTCPVLTAEDFACLAQATTKPALDKCDHATKQLADKVGGPASSPPAKTQAQDLARLADAVCACADLDCVLAVGQREYAFELPRRPFADNDPAKAAETRLKDCLKAAKPTP